MNNLLNSNDVVTESICQLIEIHCENWVLRADAGKPSIQQFFSQKEIPLPKPTQVQNFVQTGGTEITGLGISTDESWWLVPQESHLKTSNSSFSVQLASLVEEHNKQENERTLALIEQSAAYKSYQLSGIENAATELLTHLIPYDWYGLQNSVGVSENKVISTVMQSVPIVIYSLDASHHYKLLIRRSFADYALSLMQHTAQLL
jgi:sarcosine oxidase gamma subunit